jgi:hypothetical protein
MRIGSKAILPALLILIGLAAFAFRQQLMPRSGVPNATNDEAEREYRTGLGYLEGKSVKRDYAQAMTHFRASARYDYAPAEREIGDMYERGDGVPKTPAEALKWYAMAAEQGDGVAQLGIVAQWMGGEHGDIVQTVKWATICSSKAATVATQKLCADGLNLIRQIAGDGHPDEFKEAASQAAAWQPRAAKPIAPTP